MANLRNKTNHRNRINLRDKKDAIEQELEKSFEKYIYGNQRTVYDQLLLIKRGTIKDIVSSNDKFRYKKVEKALNELVAKNLLTYKEDAEEYILERA